MFEPFGPPTRLSPVFDVSGFSLPPPSVACFCGGRSTGWIVLFVPDARNLVQKGIYCQPSPTFENLYDLPIQASFALVCRYTAASASATVAADAVGFAAIAIFCLYLLLLLLLSWELCLGFCLRNWYCLFQCSLWKQNMWCDRSMGVCMGFSRKTACFREKCSWPHGTACSGVWGRCWLSHSSALFRFSAYMYNRLHYCRHRLAYSDLKEP